MIYFFCLFVFDRSAPVSPRKIDESMIIPRKSDKPVPEWGILEVLCWLKWISRTPDQQIDAGTAEPREEEQDPMGHIKDMSHLYEKYAKKFVEKSKQKKKHTYIRIFVFFNVCLYFGGYVGVL